VVTAAAVGSPGVSGEGGDAPDLLGPVARGGISVVVPATAGGLRVGAEASAGRVGASSFVWSSSVAPHCPGYGYGSSSPSLLVCVVVGAAVNQNVSTSFVTMSWAVDLGGGAGGNRVVRVGMLVGVSGCCWMPADTGLLFPDAPSSRYLSGPVADG
jgi:hypothetical protein